ncbi:hypothetical protein BOX15_Mlig014872g1, partial [Macrostomum lignano]
RSAVAYGRRRCCRLLACSCRRHIQCARLCCRVRRRRTGAVASSSTTSTADALTLAEYGVGRSNSWLLRRRRPLPLGSDSSDLFEDCLAYLPDSADDAALVEYDSPVVSSPIGLAASASEPQQPQQEQQQEQKTTATSSNVPAQQKPVVMVKSSSAVATTALTGQKSRRSGLRSAFNPAYKQRDSALHRLFKERPAAERLVTDCSCAWDRNGFLVQGRLYATTVRLCFYSKIIGFETRFTVPLASVTSLTKERTARLIPNAILVVSGQDRYFLTSLTAREKTFSVLSLLWELCPQPMHPTIMWELIHESYGNDLGLDSDDTDYVPSISRQLPSNDSSPALISSPTEEDGSGGGNGSANEAASSSVAIATDANNGLSPALPSLSPPSFSIGETSGSSLQSRVLAEEFGPPDSAAGDEAATQQEVQTEEWLAMDLPADVDTVFLGIFGRSSAWFRQFAGERGYLEIRVEQWNQRARTVSYRVPLSGAIGPRNAVQADEQRITRYQPGEAYSVEASSTSRDVPYGDAFSTFTAYQLTCAGPGRCRLRVLSELRFHRQLFRFVRGVIDASWRRGVTQHYATMRTSLTAHFNSSSASAGNASVAAAAAATASADLSASVSDGSDNVEIIPDDSVAASLSDGNSSDPALTSAAGAAASASASTMSILSISASLSSASVCRRLIVVLLIASLFLCVCFSLLHSRCDRLNELLMEATAGLAPSPPVSPAAAPPPASSDVESVESEQTRQQLVQIIDGAIDSLDRLCATLADLRLRLRRL